MLKQFIVTSSMGKRLIAKAMAVHPAVEAVLKKGKLVIVAGTTNGYIAEEILRATHQGVFNRKGFRRGSVVPPGHTGGAKPDFPGDVVLIDGAYQRGKEIFDVIDSMGAGDLILKGANAVNLFTGQAGVLIAHPMGGTIGAAVPSVIGRRVQLIVPVGLEKRVDEDINDIADLLNAADAEGPRMMPIPGKAFTELDAINQLSGAAARLVAGGGIFGAEGSAWIAVTGTAQQVESAAEIIKGLADEPPCEA